MSTPFVSELGFTYQRVILTPSVDQIIPGDYSPLTDAVMRLIDRWDKITHILDRTHQFSKNDDFTFSTIFISSVDEENLFKLHPEPQTFKT